MAASSWLSQQSPVPCLQVDMQARASGSSAHLTRALHHSERRFSHPVEKFRILMAWIFGESLGFSTRI